MFNANLETVEAPPPLEECTFQTRHLMRVGRTFFYQRRNDDGEVFGEVFACNPREADLLSRNIHKGHYIQLGVGDGKAFVAYIRNCGVRDGQRIPVPRADEILKGAWEAEFEAAKGKKRQARNDSLYKFIDPSMLKAPNGAATARDFVGGDIQPENLIGHQG